MLVIPEVLLNLIFGFGCHHIITEWPFKQIELLIEEWFLVECKISSLPMDGYKISPWLYPIKNYYLVCLKIITIS